MPKIKIVFGDAAAVLHEEGASDEKVKDFGTIEEFEFDTEAEIEAFILGMNSADGWLGWTEYQE